MSIEATEVPDKKALPEYWPFAIRVHNRSDGQRTLHAEIVLSQGSGSDKVVVSRCVVYSALKSGKQASWVHQCRSRERYTHWTVEIRRVWPFIP